jgi:hypothetical protein
MNSDERNSMIELASEKYKVSREFLNHMSTKDLQQWINPVVKKCSCKKVIKQKKKTWKWW